MSAMPSPEHQARAGIFYILAITHLQTLASIRMLCSCGMDSNARLLLRSLYENAVLWTRLRVDSIALAEYQRAVTPDDANKFWHKYLAKEKSEKFLRTELADQNQFWLGAWDEAVTDLKLKVGPVAHPSYFGSSHDARLDFHSSDDDCLIFNGPVNASHFTLSQAIFVAAMPFSLKPESSYQLQTQDFLKVGNPFNCIPHSTDSWEEYSSLVRDMIPSLFVMAVRFIPELRGRHSEG